MAALGHGLAGRHGRAAVGVERDSQGLGVGGCHGDGAVGHGEGGLGRVAVVEDHVVAVGRPLEEGHAGRGRLGRHGDGIAHIRNRGGGRAVLDRHDVGIGHDLEQRARVVGFLVAVEPLVEDVERVVCGHEPLCVDGQRTLSSRRLLELAIVGNLAFGVLDHGGDVLVLARGGAGV